MCGNVCGLVLATPTGSCLAVIKEPTRPKFEWLLQCFMLTLAGQCLVYTASIYIYKEISVCMFVPSFWPNLWVDFSETWHDDRL